MMKYIKVYLPFFVSNDQRSCISFNVQQMDGDRVQTVHLGEFNTKVSYAYSGLWHKL